MAETLDQIAVDFATLTGPGANRHPRRYQKGVEALLQDVFKLAFPINGAVVSADGGNAGATQLNIGVSYLRYNPEQNGAGVQLPSAKAGSFVVLILERNLSGNYAACYPLYQSGDTINGVSNDPIDMSFGYLVGDGDSYAPSIPYWFICAEDGVWLSNGALD